MRDVMKRFVYHFHFVLVAVCLLALAAGSAEAAMQVTLTSSRQSPEPVGTIVTWTAKVTGESAGGVWYRFRSRAMGDEFRTIVDFGPLNTLGWTAASHEGLYEVEVTVRDLGTGEVVEKSDVFQMTARTRGEPVVSPTAHPLVYLYSTAPCPVGSEVQVSFEGADSRIQQTPAQTCDGYRTVNLYVAGLRPNSRYRAWHSIITGANISSGPVLTFETSNTPVQLPSRAVQGEPASMEEGIILHGPLFPNQVVATDLAGNLVWYYAGAVSYLTRPAPGGRFFGIVQTSDDQSTQTFREFDLAGMTTKETNAARVNEQLAALGKRQITAFHHEARMLSDGKIVVLGLIEQMMPAPDGAGMVDVVGDMILVFDQDLNLVWAWDGFDQLDTTRKAVMGEMCSSGSCPKLYLAANGEDWTHCNSVAETPDGALLLSSRHQDWLFKIDYNNGIGTGEVLWRLGKDGDFTMESDDPYPWFSHQHDGQVISGDPVRVLVFDNGNARQGLETNQNSRGQLIELDEVNRVARLVLNADLGAYSFAMGSAQPLSNGGFHFDNSWVPVNSSVATETDAQGQPVYGLRLAQPEYRSFRLRNMYTAN